ncbi:hypothetical protein ABZY11_22135, partial [Streptomyces sp. NPDC006510]
YAYPPTAGHPTHAVAGAPGGYPNASAPGTFGGHPTGPVAPQPPRKRNRVALVVAGVVVAALVGGGAYMVGQRGTDDGSKNAQGDKQSSAPQTGGKTPSADDAGDNSKAPAEPKGSVYKNLSIPGDYTVTFADEPPRPEHLDVNYDGDFGYDRDTLFGDDAVATNSSENTMALLGADEPGSLAGCRANTRYTTRIEKDKLSKGSRICVKTGSGHYGLVTVHGFASKDDPSQFVNVDLTVWRNVENP